MIEYHQPKLIGTKWKFAKQIFAHPAIVGFHATIKNKLYMHE